MTKTAFGPDACSSQDDGLLNALLNALPDGVIMVSPSGAVLHANQYAKGLCQQLTSVAHSVQPLPLSVWRICEALIESRELFPNRFFVIEDEIQTVAETTLRIRVRWMDQGAVEYPCLLVTLEDRHQSAKSAAIVEAQRYHLTQREKEVWLLRRIDCDYETIAQRLYISVNTVKKHLKNIYAKRSQFINGCLPA
ncbi:MAG: helix-turn-helix transcriptional regulator [Cyanobacteria bacterium P01_H01_bin.119]